jgi:ligand-binding sensor protein
VPRSDWHKAFEACLTILISKYEGVKLDSEVEIGIDPPRADYIILVNDEGTEFKESIFKLFRKVNIIEYKRQDDALNEAVIYKACSYAGMYIAANAHGGIQKDQITISIFRAVKNPRLFSAMEKSGNLTKTDTPGIYRVSILSGIFDIPFQIVITGELEGNEYAACRVLAAKAEEADMRQVISLARDETGEEAKNCYKIILTLMLEKHRELFSMITRRANMASDALLDFFKDDIDKIVDERMAQERKEANVRLEQERQKARERLEQERQASVRLEQERQEANERLEQERKEASMRLEQERQLLEQEKQKADEQVFDIVKNLMNAYHITLEEAMEVLKIPQPKRDYYSGHLLNNM